MAELNVVDGNISPPIGTELDDATAFWGKELASENGEESLEEQAEASPEESEELLEEDSEDVQEEEYEEQDAEAESNVQLFKVRSDGEDIEVPLDELISGYSRHSSYTKKSQSLAEERKTFETEQQEARSLRQQAIQVLESTQQTAQSQTQEKDSQYWQDLKDNDPMQFMLERDELREAQMQNHQREVELQQLRAQEEAEQQTHFDNYLETQRQNLDELIPEWKDKKVADSERKLIIEYGKNIGFSDEELEKAYDSRAVATMRKAMLYDQLTQKRGTLKPVKHGSMKAGSQSVDLSNVKTRKASDKLRKTGRVEDAASIFYNMIRS